MFVIPNILDAEQQLTAALTVKTKISGVAARKRIAIVDRKTQALLWHSFTESNGEMSRILPLKYASTDYLCVTAFDDTVTYNAVVADNVQADLVP